MTEKLPVFATVAEAFRCLRQNASCIFPYVGALIVVMVATVVIAVMTGAGALLLGRFSGFQTAPKLAMVLGVGGAMLVCGVVSLPIVTSLQRLVLQGPGARFGFAYGREEWMTLWAAIRLMAACFAAMFVCAIPLIIVLIAFKGLSQTYGLAGMATTVFVLLILPVILLQFRLYLVVPAAANGLRLTLRQSFEMTRDNSWRMFGIYVLPGLFFSLLEQVVKYSLKPGFLAAILAMLVMLSSGIIHSLVIAIAFRHFHLGGGRNEVNAAPEPLSEPAFEGPESL